MFQGSKSLGYYGQKFLWFLRCRVCSRCDGGTKISEVGKTGVYNPPVSIALSQYSSGCLVPNVAQHKRPSVFGLL